MFLRIQFIALCVLFLSFPLSFANADEIVSISQIRPLVEWVETNTNLMLLPRPYVFVSREALSKLKGDEANAQLANHERIAAYYHGTIFISDEYWHPGDIADESVLVHELVHYAQDVGGESYACANQREEEAYRMQNLYLLEHGEKKFLDKSDMDRLAVCD